MISELLRIFTELSLDGGANWSPDGAAHVELRGISTLTAMPAPTAFCRRRTSLYQPNAIITS